MNTANTVDSSLVLEGTAEVVASVLVEDVIVASDVPTTEVVVDLVESNDAEVSTGPSVVGLLAQEDGNWGIYTPDGTHRLAFKADKTALLSAFAAKRLAKIVKANVADVREVTTEELRDIRGQVLVAAARAPSLTEQVEEVLSAGDTQRVLDLVYRLVKGGKIRGTVSNTLKIVAIPFPESKSE